MEESNLEATSDRCPDLTLTIQKADLEDLWQVVCRETARQQANHLPAQWRDVSVSEVGSPQAWPSPSRGERGSLPSLSCLEVALHSCGESAPCAYGIVHAVNVDQSWAHGRCVPHQGRAVHALRLLIMVAGLGSI